MRNRFALPNESEMRGLRYPYASLSARERQLMALEVTGLLNKQIGGEFGISEITVKAHRAQVTQKNEGQLIRRLSENSRDSRPRKTCEEHNEHHEPRDEKIEDHRPMTYAKPKRTPQHPIGSGFGAETAAAQVIREVDLTGKIAVVTGGYAGIGLETTRALLSAGAKVVVAGRDLSKARSALTAIPDATIDALDLMDPSSVDAFANRFVASGRPLHFLVNNAGIMANPLTRDARGYESQFSTNHLGHFQLTARLWPALRRAKGARVVSLSSVGHRRAPVNFEDPNFERREYDRWIAYGQSKSANALFAVRLDTVGEPHAIRAFSVHPGGVISDLIRYMSTEEVRAYGMLDEQGRPIIDPARNMKTPEQGAATSVWSAASRQLDGLGGVYCENCDIAVQVSGESTELRGVRPWAIDREFADQLWLLSEKLTGIRFPS